MQLEKKQADIILKERIAELSENLINETSLKAFTVNQLADKLGIAKKTIYRLFYSKSQLIDYTIETKLNRFKKNIQQKTLAGTNAIEEVYRCWHILNSFTSTFSNSIKEELCKHYPQAYKLLVQFTNGYLYSHIKSNFERGITQGVYRNDVTPSIIATYIITVFIHNHTDDDSFSLRQASFKVESELLTYHMHAIATERGVLLINKYKRNYLAYVSIA